MLSPALIWDHRGCKALGVDTRLGELVGRGRTSDVYAYGEDSVVKVPHHDVPADWPGLEATLTEAVRRQGVPAAAVRDLVEIGGRTALVLERVNGVSMWQQMVSDPDRASSLADDFVAIQRSLLSIGIPDDVPDLTDRLIRKVRAAAGLTSAEHEEAAALVEALPRGAALLHGDFHPGNILMGANGPVVIDWFDATIGHPVADIVRSSILLQPSHSAAPEHLPDATPELLDALRQLYVAAFRVELEAAHADLATWRATIAAARLSEKAEVDETGLLSMWTARHDNLVALGPTM